VWLEVVAAVVQLGTALLQVAAVLVAFYLLRAML
jgi:hypothetical protein